ncbi:MAG: hypothetical protein ACYTEL_11485 [Planctomycetota bacterium]|jgi:hypothetical protein
MSEDVISSGEKDPENSKFCNRFFPEGGKNEVKKLLAEGVRKARREKGISEQELDKLCFFKDDALPTCEEFEKDSSKMTQEVFCRAACALGLKISDVLKIHVDADNLNVVLDTMEADQGGLAAASSREAEPIPDDIVAPVYATFKILSEV